MNIRPFLNRNMKLIVKAVRDYAVVFIFGAALDWLLLALGFLKSGPEGLTFRGIASTAAPIAFGIVAGEYLGGLRRQSGRLYVRSLFLGAEE
jgi:hypothetical protein